MVRPRVVNLTLALAPLLAAVALAAPPAGRTPVERPHPPRARSRR